MTKRMRNKNKVRDYWSAMMRSTHERISRGAQKIHRMISWARNENWRRTEPKRKPKK